MATPENTIEDQTTRSRDTLCESSASKEAEVIIKGLKGEPTITVQAGSQIQCAEGGHKGSSIPDKIHPDLNTKKPSSLPIPLQSYYNVSPPESALVCHLDNSRDEDTGPQSSNSPTDLGDKSIGVKEQISNPQTDQQPNLTGDVCPIQMPCSTSASQESTYVLNSSGQLVPLIQQSPSSLVLSSTRTVITHAGTKPALNNLNESQSSVMTCTDEQNEQRTKSAEQACSSDISYSEEAVKLNVELDSERNQSYVSETIKSSLEGETVKESALANSSLPLITPKSEILCGNTIATSTETTPTNKTENKTEMTSSLSSDTFGLPEIPLSKCHVKAAPVLSDVNTARQNYVPSHVVTSSIMMPIVSCPGGSTDETPKKYPTEIIKILPNGLIVKSRFPPAKVVSKAKRPKKPVSPRERHTFVKFNRSSGGDSSFVTSSDKNKVSKRGVKSSFIRKSSPKKPSHIQDTLPASLKTGDDQQTAMETSPQTITLDMTSDSSPLTSYTPAGDSAVASKPLDKGITDRGSSVQKSPVVNEAKVKSLCGTRKNKAAAKKAVKKQRKEECPGENMTCQSPVTKDLSDVVSQNMITERPASHSANLKNSRKFRGHVQLIPSRKSNRIARRKRQESKKKKKDDSIWVTFWPAKRTVNSKKYNRLTSNAKCNGKKKSTNEKINTQEGKPQTPVGTSLVLTRSKSKTSCSTLTPETSEQFPGLLTRSKSKQGNLQCTEKKNRRYNDKISVEVCSTERRRSQRCKLLPETNDVAESKLNDCVTRKSKAVRSKLSSENSVSQNLCVGKQMTTRLKAKSSKRVVTGNPLTEEKKNVTSEPTIHITCGKKRHKEEAPSERDSEEEQIDCESEEEYVPHADSEDEKTCGWSVKKKTDLEKPPCKKRLRVGGLKCDSRKSKSKHNQSTGKTKSSPCSLSKVKLMANDQDKSLDEVQLNHDLSINTLPPGDNQGEPGPENKSGILLPQSSVNSEVRVKPASFESLISSEVGVPANACPIDSCEKPSASTSENIISNASEEIQDFPSAIIVQSSLSDVDVPKDLHSDCFTLDHETVGDKKHYTLKYKLETYGKVEVESGKDTFPCTVCGRQFDNIINMQSHAARHQVSKHHCVLCEASFADIDVLMMHLSDHAYLRVLHVFQCPVCERRFTDSTLFAVHIDMSNCSERGVILDIISSSQDKQSGKLTKTGTVSINRQDLAHRVKKGCQHEVRNQIPWHNEEQRPCAICQEMCSSNRSLSKHQTCHADNHIIEDYHFWHFGKGKETCQLCPKTSVTTFTTNVVLDYNYLPGNLVTCDICLVQLPKSRIAGHKQTAHKSYMCAWCAKIFRNLAGLRYHWRKTCSEKKAQDEKEVMNILKLDLDGQLSISFEYRIESNLAKDVESCKLECSILNCQRKFSEASNLEIHSKCHVEGMPYLCELCESAFETPVKFINHTKEHQTYAKNMLRGGLTVFECALCERHFTDHNWFVMHNKLVHGITETKKGISKQVHANNNNEGSVEVLSSYTPPTPRSVWQPGEKKPCPVCCQALGSFQVAKQHLATHYYYESKNIVVNCQCDICGKSFTRRKTLSDHIRNIHRKKPDKQREKNVVCDFCGRRFVFLRDMKLHRRIHTGETPFKCTYCDNAFISNSLRKDHEKRVHQNPTAPMKFFYCRTCGEKCLGLVGLRRHQKEVHAKDQTFRCLQCQVNFKTMSELGHHLQKHKISGKRSCEVCGLQFEKTEFANHKCEPGSYKCPKCEICFGTSVGLKTHDCGNHRENMRSQLQGSKKLDSKYECTICFKKFLNSSNLNAHSRVHSEAMLYDCSICHLPFKTRGKLEEHSDKHKIWAKRCICSYCHCNFRNFDTLRAHIKKSHHEISEINFNDPSQEVQMIFQCLECNSSYGTYKDIQDHIQESHNGQEFRNEVFELDVAPKRHKTKPITTEIQSDIHKHPQATIEKVLAHLESQHVAESQELQNPKTEYVEYALVLPEYQENMNNVEGISTVTLQVKEEVPEENVLVAVETSDRDGEAYDAQESDTTAVGVAVSKVGTEDEIQPVLLEPVKEETQNSVESVESSVMLEGEMADGESLTVYVITEDGDPAELNEEALSEIRAQLEQMENPTAVGEESASNEQEIVHITQDNLEEETENLESEDGHVFHIVPQETIPSECGEGLTESTGQVIQEEYLQEDAESSETFQQEYQIIYEDSSGETIEGIPTTNELVYQIAPSDTQATSHEECSVDAEPVYQIVHMEVSESPNAEQDVPCDDNLELGEVKSEHVVYAVAGDQSGSEQYEMVSNQTVEIHALEGQNVTYFSIPDQPVQEPVVDGIHVSSDVCAEYGAEKDQFDQVPLISFSTEPNDMVHSAGNESENEDVKGPDSENLPLVASDAELLLGVTSSQVVEAEEHVTQEHEHQPEYVVHLLPVGVENNEKVSKDSGLAQVFDPTCSNQGRSARWDDMKYEDKWSEMPPSRFIQREPKVENDITESPPRDTDSATPSAEYKENNEESENKNHKIKVKAADRKYRCGFCETLFNYYVGVERHLMKCEKKIGHLKEPKEYEMDYDFEGHSKVSLKFTVETPSGTKLVTNTDLGCSGCERQFSQEDNLKLHESLHLDTHPYLCGFCESAFPTVDNFMKHLDEHQKKSSVITKRFGVYECHECERRFTDSTVFRCHVHFKHGLDNQDENTDAGLHQPDVTVFGALRFEREKKKIPWLDGELRPCPVCYEFFKSANTLRFHINSVHKPKVFRLVGSFTCDMCGKEFKSKPLLRQHQLTHLDRKKPKTHICDHCGKGFSIRRLLVNHIRTHTGEKPFTCTICGLSFALKASMKDHMRRIHKNSNKAEMPKLLKCSICGWECRGFAEIQRHHASVHAEGKTYTCTRCFLEFQTQSDLITHNSEKHWKSTKYTCKICGSQYEDQSLLSQHECQLMPYRCSYCSVGFSNFQSWQAHEAKHTNPETQENNLSNRYLCPVCGFSYASKTILSSHLRTHNFEKPFACKLCPFKTAVKGRLVRHVRKHHAPGQEIQCTVCSKTFSMVSHLQLHTNRMHKKEDKKFYSCTLCGKTYDNKTSFASHMNRKHDGAILKVCTCNYCGCTFASATLLKRHMEGSHGTIV